MAGKWLPCLACEREGVSCLILWCLRQALLAVVLELGFDLLWCCVAIGPFDRVRGLWWTTFQDELSIAYYISWTILKTLRNWYDVPHDRAGKLALVKDSFRGKGPHNEQLKLFLNDNNKLVRLVVEVSWLKIKLWGESFLGSRFSFNISFSI